MVAMFVEQPLNGPTRRRQTATGRFH